MSEDFDREAEKERLREKFAEEEESRQSTEHMSELLLKGATMTNRHCDTCGDPIFRYDGQAFCPTCEEVVDESGGDGAADEKQSPATETDATEGTDGSQDANADSAESDGVVNQEPPGAATDPETPGKAVDRDAGETTPDPAPTGTEAATDRNRSPSAGGARPSSDAETASQARGHEGAETIGDARSSLVRTLSALAARAEATEDVRRTRDLLAAAREAAEAISALDRADR